MTTNLVGNTVLAFAQSHKGAIEAELQAVGADKVLSFDCTHRLGAKLGRPGQMAATLMSNNKEIVAEKVVNSVVGRADWPRGPYTAPTLVEMC